MTIDTSGQWRRGSTAADLAEYLREFQAGGYAVDEVVYARCARCDGEAFNVRVDDTEGYAERLCHSCGDQRMMLDSADTAEDAEPESAACPCGNEVFQIAAGFAKLAGGEMRWVSIGLRCLQDDVLGVYADWKIDYSPSAHLTGNV